MDISMMESEKKTAKVIGGVLKVVGNMTVNMMTCGVIRAVLPPGVNLFVQGGCLVGGLMLGDLLGTRLGKHIDDSIKESLDVAEEVRADFAKQLDVILNKDLEKEDSEEDE